jgi:phosphate transport system protein
MARERYRDQLDTLRGDVLSMAALVTDRLETALDALESSDHDRARELVGSDDAVNERYLDIERECIDLFALQQPVATDLRFVAASFKICTDLERVADLAVNLAEYTLVADHAEFPGIDLRETGGVAAELLDDAVTAYAEENAWACHEVADTDDELDALCERAGRAVLHDLVETEATTARATDRLVETVFSVALALRDIERIGDHAVNIAARTLYMLESDDSLI